HRLSQVDSVAHFVGDVLKLGAKPEPSECLDSSVERLNGASRRRHDAVDPGCRFQKIRLEVSQGCRHVEEQELISRVLESAQDVSGLGNAAKLTTVAGQAFRRAE